MIKTKLAILGAGPYGLAGARYARHIGVEPIVLGQPMAAIRSTSSGSHTSTNS